MKVKQESCENDTTVVKQVYTIDVPLTEAIKEAEDALENQQANCFSIVEVKNEPQRSLGELMLYSKNDVSETSILEVEASDLIVTPDDLHLIKQEVTKIEYIVPKADLLTDDCDLPVLKSEEEVFTSNWNKLEQYKNNGLKKKFKGSKNYSRLHINGFFWNGWRACEFCGHFYNKFDYFSHYFIHSVKINVTHLWNYKNNKTSVLKKHKKKRFVVMQKGHVNFHVGEKPFKNRLCSKKIIQKSNLNNYLEINNIKKLFTCKICLKQFTRNTHLKQHFRTHTGEKPFKCKNCLKQFTQKSNLRHHLRIHTGEKPFKCKLCLKQFTHKSTLNNHLKIHIGEKPFKCEICLNQFIRKGDLNKHLKFHSGKKPFQCEICLNQFICKSYLSKHLKIHTGEKPFQCEMCSKQFVFKDYLNKHLKTHTGEKPFTCRICLKQFTQHSNIKQHLKTHTGEKPFKCEICLKQFTRNAHLKRHRNTHTGKK